MIPAREGISVALFNLIKNASYPAPAPFFSRKYISTADLGSARMPAVCMIVQNEHAEMMNVRGIPVKWKLEVLVFIFVSTSSPGAEPETVLNNILDSIDKALAAPLGSGPLNNRQTLGGLVHDCRINGTIERDPGFISGIGAAAIPIEIVTTN